jgi:hypothetical protein
VKLGGQKVSVFDVRVYHNWLLAGYHVCLWLGTNMCKWPLACVWYLTLKQACALASLRVRMVQGAIERLDVDDGRWQREVVEPLTALATWTVPTVSEGWGSGAAFLCLSLPVLPWRSSAKVDYSGRDWPGVHIYSNGRRDMSHFGDT